MSKEKNWIDTKTNFFYIQRGLDRTPPGSTVEIVECNCGLQTNSGTLKGTKAYGLRNITGQFIAYSNDTDDLILFALEHEFHLDPSTWTNYDTEKTDTKTEKNTRSTTERKTHQQRNDGLVLEPR